MATVTLFLEKQVVLHLAKSPHLQNRTFITVFTTAHPEPDESSRHPRHLPVSSKSFDFARCLPGFHAK